MRTDLESSLTELAHLRVENKRLQAENERLREALRKIASCDILVDGDVVSIVRHAIAKAEGRAS